MILSRRIPVYAAPRHGSARCVGVARSAAEAYRVTRAAGLSPITEKHRGAHVASTRSLLGKDGTDKACWIVFARQEDAGRRYGADAVAYSIKHGVPLYMVLNAHEGTYELTTPDEAADVADFMPDMVWCYVMRRGGTAKR